MRGIKVSVKRGREQGKVGEVIGEKTTHTGRVFFTVRLIDKDIVVPFNDVVVINEKEEEKNNDKN